MSQRSNILSGEKRFKMSPEREAEWLRSEAMPMRAVCGLCDGKLLFEGPTSEAREIAREHREKVHPETIGWRRSKRNTRKLSSFRYVSLDQEDIKEVEEEIKKRAFLNGVEIEVRQ